MPVISKRYDNNTSVTFEEGSNETLTAGAYYQGFRIIQILLFDRLVIFLIFLELVPLD